MRGTKSRIYKTACADGRGLALAGMYLVLNPSGYIPAAHNKKGSIMKKRQTPADAAADIERQAARAATRKIQGTESIGGGYTITGGCEIDLTQYAQTKQRTSAKKQKSFNALSGLRRTWVKQYIDGAILDYYYLGKRRNIKALCPVLIAVVDAIASGELKRDFSEAALLQWAEGSGLTLTAAGLAAWERLDTTEQQANTKTRKAADGGLAAAIGADGWADIRLVVRADGVTFHGPGGWRALPWNTVGLGEEKAAAQTAFLILLAKAGGHLPHSERVESKPDTGGNRTTWTAKDWEREAERATIRKFSERAAGENEQTKLRANVRRLNEKFMALFPSIQGRPFENKKGSTISNFKLTEFR